MRRMKGNFMKAAADARRKAGLSQLDAAQCIGVTDRMLCHYENGHSKIPPDIVSRMADVYAEPGLRTMYCQTECALGTCTNGINPCMDVASSLLDALTYDVRQVEDAMKKLHEITRDGVIHMNEKAAFDASCHTLRTRDVQLRQVLLSSERFSARSPQDQANAS